MLREVRAGAQGRTLEAGSEAGAMEALLTGLLSYCQNQYLGEDSYRNQVWLPSEMQPWPPLDHSFCVLALGKYSPETLLVVLVSD